MFRISSLILAASLTLTACGGAEIDQAPAAAVTDAKPDAAPTAAPEADANADATVYKADTGASKIEWVGAKITKSHPGGFKTFDSEAHVADGKLVGLRASIDLTSTFSDSEKLTGHLLSEDFFAVEKYKTATFQANTIKEGSTVEGATHTVEGTLDFHGVKKDVTFPATVTVGDDGVTTKAEFSINRKDWGLQYPGKPDDLIKDDVLVKLDMSYPKA